MAITGVAISKANVYAVISIAGVQTSKVNAYAVVIPVIIAGVATSKANVYGVAGPGPGVSVTKANAYAVLSTIPSPHPQAVGPFRWRPKVSVRDLYNGVKGTFISPINKWQSSDFPPYAQDTLHGYASGSPLYPDGDANMAADGGDRRWLDIQLPFTISVSMAQRLAKIELMRRRQQGTGTFHFSTALYMTTALDIVAMTLPIFGWVAKLLEVSAFRFTFEKATNAEGTLLGCEIDVQESDPSVYAWSTAEELSSFGYQQAGLPTNIDVFDGFITVNGS